MKIKVRFFAPFRELFCANESEIELKNASDVQELLNHLCNSHERREKIFDQFGELRPYVMILKNGQPIQTLDGFRTKLEEGDEIAIFPPVSGG